MSEKKLFIPHDYRDFRIPTMKEAVQTAFDDTASDFVRKQMLDLAKQYERTWWSGYVYGAMCSGAIFVLAFYLFWGGK